MADTPTPEDPDLLDSAVEAVPSLQDIDAAAGRREDPDLLDSAVEAVPSLQDLASATEPTETPGRRDEVGGAGAADESAPDLLPQALPPAEFTEADYAAYDAEQEERRATSDER
jgi:hypothetical protein